MNHSVPGIIPLALTSNIPVLPCASKLPSDSRNQGTLSTVMTVTIRWSYRNWNPYSRPESRHPIESSEGNTAIENSSRIVWSTSIRICNISCGRRWTTLRQKSLNNPKSNLLMSRNSSPKSLISNGMRSISWITTSRWSKPRQEMT